MFVSLNPLNLKKSSCWLDLDYGLISEENF